MESSTNSDTLNFGSDNLEITYRLSERKHRYEETDINTTYGVTAYFNDSLGKQHTKTVNDISSVKETVEEIIVLLENEKVSLYHFEAVIEDVLFERNIL